MKDEVDSIFDNIVLANFFYVFKRLFDIFVSLFGVVFCAFVAAIIKVIYIFNKDYSSIFFIQERIGRDGEIFKLYKFRSMIHDADKVLEEILSTDSELSREYQENKKFKDDPRVTRLGNFLRKTSLDEIPQFINVLKGDMSLIGNRPYLPREKKEMGKYYHDIVKTRPGLTGYWQVNGRSNTTFKKRLEMEAYYSKHQSLKMDIKIFIKTIYVVILHIGSI